MSSGTRSMRDRDFTTVVGLPDGTRLLTLTRFQTSPGPDLRVRLVPGDTTDGYATEASDITQPSEEAPAEPGGAPLNPRSPPAA